MMNPFGMDLTFSHVLRAREVFQPQGGRFEDAHISAPIGSSHIIVFGRGWKVSPPNALPGTLVFRSPDAKRREATSVGGEGARVDGGGTFCTALHNTKSQSEKVSGMLSRLLQHPRKPCFAIQRVFLCQ